MAEADNALSGVVITNTTVVAEALILYVDGQMGQMVYARNKYRISDARRHYKKALAGLKELDNVCKEPVPTFDWLRKLNPVEYGIGE